MRSGPAPREPRRERFPGALALAIVALVSSSAGCSRPTSLEPPAMRYGVDVCAHCNMIVNEERFAAATLAVTGDGNVEPFIFDDLSCLVAYEAAHPECVVRRRYVHDAVTGAWVDAAQAFFVMSPSIRSPMGGGVLALGTRAAADSLSLANGGEVLAFGGLGPRLTKGS